LPKISPRVKGIMISGRTLPATHVGGDYFDYWKITKNKIGLILADVSGKGMPAAMHVQKMQGILQAARGRLTTSNEILLELQAHLSKGLESKSFVTAVSCVIDTVSGQMELSQAGHLPVLHLRGNRIQNLKPPGLWIGKTSSRTFRSSLKAMAVRLKKEDVVLFYSDGCIEARNCRGAEFGLNRLKKAVSARTGNAREVLKSCFEEIRHFSGHAPQGDDMTMIAITVSSTFT
jgi:sigma-B regulation protein RsbU (phosphoserine phosphatase)